MKLLKGSSRMNGDHEEPGIPNLGGQTQEEEVLPFRIELWSADLQGIEKVLARAVNASLAHAIFTAVKAEHPGRRIVLRNQTAVVSQSE